MITDKEINDELFAHSLVRDDLTAEELSDLKKELEKVEELGGTVNGGVLCCERLKNLAERRRNAEFFIETKEWDKLREMIARCKWTFAKTMPWCPHEYIVRGKCPLSEEEFLYFIEMQRNYGKVERWGKYITPYLYIDGYKYWTMGAPVEETIVINRAKVTIKRSSESDGECR